MIGLLVAVGAAVGAPARYFTDRWIQGRHGAAFPWGTLVVNVAGSFVLGVIVGRGVSDETAALIGTGFCGALTTYSTFGYETHRLLQDRSYLLAAANVLGSLAAGLAAATVGVIVGAWLAP